jgi:hypothetical protein
MTPEFDPVFSKPTAQPAFTKTSLARESLTQARPASSFPVFVDVGSRKIESQIERDGVPIGVLAVDQVILKDLILDRPILRVKVVSQSVRPGTPVPVGTTVDLVMAPPGDLPVGVITGVHLDLKDVTIATAFNNIVADNPVVNRIVTHAVAGQLSPEDTAAVREIFAGVEGVEITDEPGKDINAAVETLRVLKTFGA